MVEAMIVAGMLLTEDNIKISYDHYKNGNNNVVIMAPGYYNSKKSPLLKELASDLTDDFDVIVFDFRGHGDSKGLFHWSSKEYLDLRAVVEFAKEQYGHICVVGFSMGGTISIIEASVNGQIDSLVIVSAPSDMSKVDYDILDIDVETDILFGLIGNGAGGKGVRPGPFWQKKTKPVDVVHKVRAPTLYMHGEDDWLIKPWHSEELYGKTLSEKKLVMIADGPHAEYLVRNSKSELSTSIIDWFKKSMADGEQK
ncbi:MAG: alpha/beta fold hydrolase [Candidatus Omnitrophica bacterium]|nr:alpha/beta fold hydrolase [Candidatus Omnitrophota bacterium]